MLSIEMFAMNYCYVVDLENASRIEYVYFASMLDVQFHLEHYHCYMGIDVNL